MDLSGKLLIAMPGMTDPRFEKSVIFMCAHSGDGAMGLIINHPARDVSFLALLEQLSISHMAGAAMPAVHLGGPVEHGRGFVLHSLDYEGNAGTLKVDSRFGMTATLDILEDIAHGEGPAESLLALGYSGWGPGQIEAELQQNAWLVGEASEQIVFSSDSGAKWGGALALMGIDPLTLSGVAGRA
ncbi:MAG: YqgE/AlgH family protein [Rhodobacteraceae bacterium]|nr:YqgE/AlgH family protein [Paracoccaceae bacterium]